MFGFNAGPAGIPVITGELTSAKIRELMHSAQQDIAQRKREMGLPGTPAVQQIFPVGLISDPEKAERARRLSQLQAKVASRCETLIPKVEPVPDLELKQKNIMRNLIFDEHGKTVDSVTGEEVKIPHHRPTLKANVRAQQVKDDSTTQKKPTKLLAASPYFDPRLSFKQAMRPKRNLEFFEQGKFIKQAERLRIKAQLDKLQESVAQAAKRTGIASAVKLATIQPKRRVDEASVPDIEWWDAYILKDGVSSYSYLDEAVQHSLPAISIVNEAWITDLIEHPIQMKPPTELTKPPEIPLLLTKKERKKLRRQNRREVQNERQEQIRLGLANPPEPKVKLANLMRVLGSEAVQDPSKVEAYVRKQMETRKRAHEAANASRKLTKEQARYKRIRKVREDTSNRIHVAVYRVKDFTNPSHRFKVETNANQLFMTGVVALNHDCNVVVVEGGPKQQKRMKRLMLHRIKWLENKRGVVEASKEESATSSDPCVVVWEGSVKQRAFENVQTKVCPTELFARELFRKRDVEHYWDMAYSGAIMESAEETAN